MAWVQLGISDQKQRLNEQELNKLLEENADPNAKLLTVLGHVATDIVGRVNAGRRKRGLPPVVNTGLYVPPGSQRHAYVLSRLLLTNSFPSLDEYNAEDRRQAVDDANQYLTDLANNDADSDDDGAMAFVPSSSAPVRFGGAPILNFIEVP